MAGSRILRGSYTYRNGQFVPDGEMREIVERLARMKLLADTGDGVPSFYVDDAGDFWEYTQAQDYRTELRRVDRSYI